MKIKYLYVAAALFLVSACKQNKNSTVSGGSSMEKKDTVMAVTPAPAPAPVDEPAVNKDSENKEASTDPIMGFIVSFYSIGSGTDRGQPEKMRAFIDAFGKKNNMTVEFKETHWGREGETDFCFPLNGWSDKEIADFKSGARDLLKGAEHVNFMENQPCRKERVRLTK